MALRVLLKDQKEFDALPDVLKDEYVKQDDGTFILAVEEKDYSTRIKEFRDNNLTLKKQMEKVNADLKKFENVDPEAYQVAMEAKEKLEKLEQDNLLKGGNIDEVVSKRTEQMRVDYEKRLKSAQETASKYEQDTKRYREQVRHNTISQTIRDAVQKVGNPRSGAMTDILNRATRDWQLDDADQLIAPDKFDDKGEPITVDYWAKQLVTDSPYLFEASQGGGASGGTKGSGDKGRAPKVLVNPSPREFGKNLEAIATGKVEAIPTGG